MKTILLPILLGCIVFIEGARLNSNSGYRAPVPQQSFYQTPQKIVPQIPQQTYSRPQTVKRPPPPPQQTYSRPQTVKRPLPPPQQTYSRPQTVKRPPPPPQQTYNRPQTVKRPQAYSPSPSNIVSSQQSQPGMPYDFDWGVEDSNSGNSYSHTETSDGSTTKGQYKVLLPDGRVQVVTFFDNGGGFVADVTYE